MVVSRFRTFRKRAATTFAAGIGVLVLLSGCTPLVVGGGAAAGYKVATDERSAGRLLDDAAITAKIKTEMIGDEEVKARDVDVDTVKGVVYLNGLVDTEGQKKRAAKIAGSMEGVKSVRNNLRVGARSMGQAFDDQILGSKIKGKLIQEPGIRSANIDVDVYNGIVALTGLVESKKQKARVIEIARSTTGAVRIVDNIEVKGP